VFFAALVIDGALAGAVYALVGLAFVVVYKASRAINFALGEWAMFASRVAALGPHALGLPLAGALGLAGAVMVGLALAFNRVILRPLVGQPAISLLMVTIGFGAVLRGVAALAFAGVPRALPLPFAPEPLDVAGIAVATDRLAAAIVALACIAAVSWLFRRTRTGVALRALADDQQVAMTVGIDVDRHLAITWALAGLLAVVAGVLWSFIGGGGLSLVLVGLRVFPIVVIGGLDSIPGTIVGAVLVGVLESLAAGYVDPVLGAGFSSVVPYALLLAVLFVRPHGLFGRPEIQRV